MTHFFLDKGPAIRRGILLSLAFGLPVVVLKGVTYDPYNVPKLALLIAGTSLAGAIRVAEVLMGARSEGLRRLVTPAVAITLPLLVAWIASPYREWALFGEYSRFQGLIPYVFVVLFGVLAADAFGGRPLPLAWALAGAGGVVGGYTLVQMLGLDPWTSAGSVVGTLDTASTLGHTNFSGGFMAIALPPCIYLWATARRRRRTAMVLTILTAEGLLLTNSQGGWAAGVAGVAVLSGFLFASRWPFAPVAGVLVAAGVIVVVIGSVLATMVGVDLPVVGETVRTRGLLWTSAVGMAAESPVLGGGPNVYALEGVRHTSLASALAEYGTRPDDPHSVPLAHLANAGALGAAGYLLTAAWVVRRGSRQPPAASLPACFFACATAYFVQSLVSIDEISLRVGLWTALAGLAASAGTLGDRNLAAVDRTRRCIGTLGALRYAAAVSVIALVPTTAAWWSMGLVHADRLVARGEALFEAERLDRARRNFRDALDIREEPEYRRAYAVKLGLTALDRGERGAVLMAEMRAVMRYLDRLPDVPGMLTTARLLHHWGSVQPAADRQALPLYERARRLNPNDPMVDVEMSEVLLDLARDREALRTLQPLATSLDGAFPAFWGALSVARLKSGDERGAVDAWREGRQIDPQDCRVLIAEELLRVDRHGANRMPPPGRTMLLHFACEAGLYQLMLDRLPPPVQPYYR